MTLHPGDLLTCGSPLQPKVLIKDGDAVSVEIDGIGNLEVKVADPLRRSWPAAV
jgi:2-keto-4-pentenoate hydratase/2-oxohepta-3-ene-1,7-dioic acid hydratase in catechol pathway